MNASAIVEPAWLDAHRDDPAIRILDASWHMPADGRDARAEFETAHIAGAAFFDIDAISDPDSDLPHMLPCATDFGETVGALGIDNDTHVIAYGTNGLFSAPRVWWMFRAFGHDCVSVLSGGLARWQAEGRPTESGPTRHEPRRFAAQRRDALVRTLDQIRSELGTDTCQVVDARGAGRFNGTVPEPRPGLRSGHIPGSRNLPYGELSDADGSLRSGAEIRSLFDTAGVSLDRPIVTSCGSGITACILALALFEVGRDDVAVYDGSWTEWGGRADTPVEL